MPKISRDAKIQGMLVVVTAGILITAGYQAYLLSQTMRNTQSAFLYITDTIIIYNPRMTVEENSDNAIQIAEGANAGQTPARRAVVNLNYCMMTGDLPKDFNYPSDVTHAHPELLVGPKSPFHISIPVPMSKLVGMKSRGEKIYAFGIITYIDIFNTSHTTHFCKIYSGHSIDKITGIVTYRFNDYKEHNCYDADCSYVPIEIVSEYLKMPQYP